MECYLLHEGASEESSSIVSDANTQNTYQIFVSGLLFVRCFCVCD